MRVRRPWILRAVPRIVMLVTAVAVVIRGDVLYGLFCLLALGLTIAPVVHARRLGARVPIELELVFLWFVLADMTLGNWFGLYRLAWYDKVLHLSSSILIAWLGFLAIYVLHVTHDTRFRPWLDAVAILLVTLGLGALWEIGEYGVDQLFGRATQGSPQMSAHDDTMVDLIMDGLGGVLGAVLGPLYIRYAHRGRAVVDAVTGILGGSAPQPQGVTRSPA